MARKKSELVKALENQAQPLGYQQCEWLAGTERCHYPGSMSTNTGSGGPYFCRLHFACSDPIYGADVVAASRDYKHPTEAESMAAHTQQAKANLEAYGLARGETEAFSAWRKRCMQWVRQRRGNVAKRFP